eukprot:TRINITY_DN12077_c0_g1_i1.p2 TRINITY_DN12077_c0_g1~~TRINITY_DN12077_c0_g1_i1.p2  ORF type:complete len:136 (+),score=38.84 TRINITY_DN12077_c0_g1_i1:82-489(+)
MSADLVWSVIRNRSSFLVKRNGLQLTSEPFNLKNENSFKFSGLANSKAVDITPNKERGVVLSLKSKKRSNQYKLKTNKTVLRRDFRRSSRSIVSQLKQYRPDLRNAALARLSAITKASKTVAVQKKKSRRSAKKQ